MGTLTSWNTLGHSRPVTGLLYLYSSLKYTVSLLTVFSLYNFCVRYHVVVHKSKKKHLLISRQHNFTNNVN